MGTMAQLYLRCESDEILDEIRRAYPEARRQLPSAFCSIAIPFDERMEAAAVRDIARRHDTEAIYLMFQSASDSFEFIRSRPGQLDRHLRYGCYVEQGIGEIADGPAEPWEAAAFFSPRALDYVDADDPDRQKVEHIFREHLVAAGAYYPTVDARESARAAAVHYRLTDWLDDWLTPLPGDRLSLQTAAAPGLRQEAAWAKARTRQRLIGILLALAGTGATAYLWQQALVQGVYWPKASFLTPVFAFLGLSIALFPMGKEEAQARYGSTQLGWTNLRPMQKRLIIAGLVAGALNACLGSPSVVELMSTQTEAEVSSALNQRTTPLRVIARSARRGFGIAAVPSICPLLMAASEDARTPGTHE